MNILFYTPMNTRCRDIESQAAEFCKTGHSIFLLTQSPYGPLHHNFASYGYKVVAMADKSRFTNILVLKRLVNLISFCVKNRIDVVYAHLEPSNFIAVIAQYFIPARVVICRHHIDEAELYSFGKDLSYKLTYKLAREIIVVSKQAKQYMVHREGVSAKRIHHINLAYDFTLYGNPDTDRVKKIRNQYGCQVLVLSVCRLTKYKRPELSIEVLKKLITEGYDAKLIILGKGDLLQTLREIIEQEGLSTCCFLEGHVDNVLEYMAASDFLVHPSLLESSCISLKEAGLVKLPVIVCKGIGDFDEVVNHCVNGFLADPKNFVTEAYQIISEYADKKEKLLKIGENLFETVLTIFEIKKAAPYYEQTFHNSRT